MNETAASTSLLQVPVSAPCEAANATAEVGAKEQSTPSGAIHIEFPGRGMISVECGADAALLRSIIESLRKWITCLAIAALDESGIGELVGLWTRPFRSSEQDLRTFKLGH
jgi:hypothetical protein